MTHLSKIFNGFSFWKKSTTLFFINTNFLRWKVDTDTTRKNGRPISTVCLLGPVWDSGLWPGCCVVPSPSKSQTSCGCDHLCTLGWALYYDTTRCVYLLSFMNILFYILKKYSPWRKGVTFFFKVIFHPFVFGFFLNGRLVSLFGRLK